MRKLCYYVRALYTNGSGHRFGIHACCYFPPLTFNVACALPRHGWWIMVAWLRNTMQSRDDCMVVPLPIVLDLAQTYLMHSSVQTRPATLQSRIHISPVTLPRIPTSPECNLPTFCAVLSMTQ